MDFIESTLLPCLMELLSREDNLCTTVEELTESVKDVLLEKQAHPFGSLELAVKFAVDVGCNLGIFSFDDYLLPEPFNFRAKKPALKRMYTTAQGRMAVKRMLANSRAKPKSKAKASAKRSPGRKLVRGKQPADKTNRKGFKRNLKTKSKKRCS